MKLLAEGLTYGQIAPKLGIGVSTVRTHLHDIYGLLGVGDRAQAVIAASEEGWLEVDLVGHKVPHEIRLLRNVQQLLQDLIEAVDRRRERLGITRAQDQYLREFERYLREPTHTGMTHHRGRTVELLWQILDEAGLERGHVAHRRQAGPRMKPDAQAAA